MSSNKRMTSEVHQHATMSDKTNASRFLLLRPRERCCAPPPATFPDGKVVHRAISILLLLLAAAACSSCHAFQRMITTGPPRTLQSVRRYSVLHVDRIPRPIIRATRWYSTFSADDIDNDNNDDDDAVSKNQVSAAAAANKLREEAACIRLEAEKLDWELTMSKLKALDDKVTKLQKPKQQSDPEKLKEAIDALEDQIQLLQQKLVGQRQRNESTTRSDGSRANQSRPFSSSSSSMPVARKLVATASSLGGTEKSPLVVVTTAESDRVIVSSSGEVMATVDPSLIMVSSHTVKSASSTNTKKKGAIANLDDDEILAGFDQSDLDLYIPVALEIEARLTNATADEKLEAFRTAPELQEHFQQKITQLLVEPMQGMQRLEDLKSQYLASSSTKEKEQLKRQIDALTISFEEDGPFQYSDSVYRETLELTEAARQAKLDAVSALPEILHTLYKKRHNLESDADLKLAVLLDHYEEQMQLLEQVKHVTPLSTQVRKEVVQAIESLPVVLQDHMAAVFGLNKDNYTVDKLIVELSKDDDDDDDDEGIWKWNPLKQMSLAAVEETTPDLPEYDDIDFVDRSRYVDEFYPAIARLEGQHPSLEAIDTFTRTVIDKQAFMMSSKAERVIGGYYIRGQNLVDLDNSGVQLMERLRGRMEQYQSLFGVDEQLEFFYIPDPSPLTDEEVELEFRNDPVILVTGKNATKFYNYASPWTKASVSAFGLFSMGVFALGVCGLDPALQQRLNAVSDVAAAGGAVDLSWLTDIVSQVVLSLCAIQVAHEAGHRFVAWRDKVSRVI